MKTLRITAALLIAFAAAACSGSTPTGPSLELDNASAQMDGTGFIGGGTK